MGSTKLYVGGLPFLYTKDDLKRMGAKYGEVEDAFIVFDKTSDTPKSKGFGFLTFKDSKSADEFIRVYDGKTFEDRLLAVELAKSASSGGRSGGGRDGGVYRGGRGGGGYGGGRGGRGGRDGGGYGGGRDGGGYGGGRDGGGYGGYVGGRGGQGGYGNASGNGGSSAYYRDGYDGSN